MRLILLGAPGSGKGTQGPILAERFDVPVISTGDILRAAVAEQSKMGQQAKSYMDKGELVPDEVIIGIMQERLAMDDAQNGFILDGFPRTTPQAEALSQMLRETFSVAIDNVINLEVSEEELVDRLGGRRVCSQCGATFHIEAAPPKQEDICDRCGGKLVQRDDDKRDTILKRMQVFREQTSPLVTYYDDQGLLCTVRATGSVDQISTGILSAIGK
ncbi:adenylate kinase [Desulfurispira natronophila]|uniref:Adenylate kinase n=1 Tax=Desulfurispira natronophila TaxID=682562 RepID=A0A7W8DHF2_9BACT|nr:adenylate kinase [Desulfurispira natronophila]MBB5022425.1 adenylate kinase [Desulfurispira natronophila]